jgi:hypothetical protein
VRMRELNGREQRQLDAASIAPAGFVYPEQYERALAEEPLPEIMPWVWLTEYRDQLGRWAEIVSDQFPNRRLVPFAKHDATDDVFCFPADDQSGNPPVQIIHTFTKPGWEFRGEFPSFDEWWDEMTAHRAEWLEEQDDDA